MAAFYPQISLESPKKELDIRLEHLRRAMDEINAINAEIEKPTLSVQSRMSYESMRDRKVQAARDLDSQIAEFRNKRESELQAKFLTLRTSIIREIMVVANRLIKSKEFDLVFDVSGASMGQTPLVLYSPNVDDFSQEVIDLLNTGTASSYVASNTNGSGLRLASVNLERIMSQDLRLQSLSARSRQPNEENQKKQDEELTEAKRKFLSTLMPKLVAFCKLKGADVLFDSSGLSMGQIPVLISSNLIDFTDDAEGLMPSGP